MAALLAVAAASVAVAAADAAAFARRPPPRLQVRELALRPAIGEAEASHWGIQDGFEGGRFLKTDDGLYHCFPSERMRRGTGQGNGTLPSDLVMQIGHWASATARPGSWYRVGTLVRSTGLYNASGVHSSTWAGMPVYDDDTRRWHLFYVGYRSAPMNGSHAYVQFGGVIVHAVSSVPGPGGLGGPYEETGVVLNETMPGTNLSWEGDQGDDAFFPYRLRNGEWYGFFGSALSRKKTGGWNADWHVGLATAPRLAGPWAKRPGNPLRFDGAVENPVVTLTQDGEYYMAVYYPFAGFVGFTWSRDGVTWSRGVHLNVTPHVDPPCGGTPVTALGLVPEPQLGPGIFSLLFTGRGTNDFENICYALLEDLETPKYIFDFSYFEDVLFPSWVDFFRVKDGFAFNAFGSCKSENRTILCPASMYGSTDMVYAYFAVGLLDELRKNQVKAWAKQIQQFQNPATGRFQSSPGPAEAQPWHALAQATEALHVLGEEPLWPMEDLKTLSANASAMKDFVRLNLLASSDVRRSSASLQAPPGIVQMAHLLRWATPMRRVFAEPYQALVEQWFQELDKLVDPASGLWFAWSDDPRNASSRSYEQLPSIDALYSSFHILHVYECFNRPWQHPKRLVDAALQLQREDGLWSSMPSSSTDLGGVYIAIHGSRQSGGYRWADVREMCRKYLQRASSFLNDETWIFGSYAKEQGTHLLSGPLFAVAECQIHFPELHVKTRRPWRRKRGACIYA